MNKRSFVFVLVFVVSFVMIAWVGSWLQLKDIRPVAIREASETDWVTAVHDDILAAEYQISPQNDAYQAPNRENQFRTYFNEQGITIVPRADAALDWTWELQLVRAGDRVIAAEATVPVLTVDQNKVTYARRDIAEWYINDVNGLEQGFTVYEPVAEDAILELDLAISGDLIPVMVSGNDAIDFAAAGGAHVLRYADLYAFDANGRILPSHMSLVDLDDNQQAIRLSVDTVAAAYPLTIDPVASTAPWQAFITEDANFGFDVSDAGDVDGDGYDDVIVGANWFDSGQAKEGAAFLYYGSAAGLSQTYDWMVQSNSAQAQLGYAVSTAGDINNDGYDDLIVGAPGYLGTGGAFIFFGDASGPATAADIVLEGGQDASKFGFSVSTAGYVNNDSFADVIVGAPEYDGSWGADEGRAYVYYGSGSGLSSTPDWTSEIDEQFEAPGAKFGFSVDTAGDFDQNGFDDVVIGAPKANPDGEAGLIVIFPGAPTGLPNSGGVAASSDGYKDYGDFNTFPPAEFGYAVAGVGDVNGDNIDDILVGAPANEDGQLGDKGAAFLFLGATDRFTTSTGANLLISLSDQDTRFGADVHGAGDVNKDGLSDFIIGVPMYDGSTNTGAAYVVLGDENILSNLVSLGYFGEQPGSFYGGSVSGMGDVNGDGYDDFVVGAPEHNTAVSSIGQAFGYYGYGTIRGLTAVNDSPVVLNEVVNFNAAITEGGHVDYSWDFGDDKVGVGADPSHMYDMPGLYTATVTVENPLRVMTATTLVAVTVDQLVTPENGGVFSYTNSMGQGTGVNVPPGAVDSARSLSINPLGKESLTQPEPTNPIDYYFDLGADDPRRIYFPVMFNRNSGSSLVNTQVVDTNGASRVEGETAVAACPTGHFCFNKPVIITITYNEDLLPPTASETELTLTFWDNETNEWVDAATTCDPTSTYNYFPAQDFFTIEVCHFSRFGVVH